MNYEEFLEDLPDLAVAVDPSGGVAYANAAFSQVVSDDSPRSWIEHIHSDDRPAMRTLMEEAMVAPKTGPCRLRNGVEVQWRLWARREGGLHLLGTLVEVHPEQQQLRRVLESEARLQDFCRVVAHDLKAPIRGAKQLTAWLREDLGSDLSPPADRHMALLEDRVARMDHLLEGLSRFTRSLRALEEPESVNVTELVEASVAPSDHYQISTENLPRLVTPRAPLEHVLGNLIRNAVQHHDQSVAHIQITAERRTSGWEFCVTDDGPGIPPRLQERVFTMFLSLNPGPERFGIGLPLVQRILERLGGTITCESPVADERGTRMRVFWPSKWRHPEKASSRAAHG